MCTKNKFIKSLSFILVLILLIAPIISISSNASDIYSKDYYVGGMPFGVKLISNGLTVVKFSEDIDNTSSASSSNIQIGDIIIKINGKSIKGYQDFSKIIEESNGKPVEITILRKGKELTLNITPKYSEKDKKFKTGLWVKDSTTGIGTITYVDPETGEFGGLGHGICDSLSGNVLSFNYGLVMDVSINGVNKGTKGTAGELKGSFELRKLGTLVKNSECGVFGYLKNDKLSFPEKLKICPKKQVKCGDAYIWCSLDNGSPQKYSIKITEITSNSDTKNFKIKVTDPQLLEKAGGIVQGMSGSPIIQDGKLVGAVTHVLINDPTAGYGIFIENMLKQTS